MNRTGDVLGGRYELTDRIAAGGMGEVWKATDQVLGRTVALKLLKDGLTDEIGFTERFRNEARLSAALTHGNVAQVYDYGEDDGTAYLVMEYVPGMPLSKIIAENAPISAADTAGLLAQAASALQAAHRSGLIHRDVKPANMLVTADGIVKLTDFGIARAIGSAAMTKTGEVMGTAQYLAPEAALGHEVTGLVDVYALGIIAYEMVTGRRPFESDSPVTLALAHVNQTPPQMPQEVPPPVRAIILATLEKNPALRPDSAAEFSRALRQAVVDSTRMGFDPNKRAPKQTPGGPAGSSGPHSPQNSPHPGPASGPHSGGSGPQHGNIGGPLPGRQEVSHHPAPTGPSAPPSGHPAAAGFKGDPSGPNAPTSGPQASTSGPNNTSRLAASSPATRKDKRLQPSSGGSSTVTNNNNDDFAGLGISKSLFMKILGGVVALLLLIVVLVVVLNQGGKVTPPRNPTETQQQQQNDNNDDGNSETPSDQGNIN
ncbi:serine/threonine-protein kinase [Yimella sp. NH-Cas1]|uniref:serine/threonine-protein kinase n=1 Tax=Yimella sp. NH-Cas1 TaxID=2917726 RepID=UPI001EFB4ED4|nr:serine/threonine-protein kinase [Yimella sp. NH-Cas1]MCG8656792.1 protein kinase [Yimella sp. NH-Cas1]